MTSWHPLQVGYNRTLTQNGSRKGDGGLVKDWKDIPGDSKEKYSLYLCSREWSEKKEAVHARSGGICERCLIHAIDHVHHLTYARRYAELFEDLQGICKPCHDFTHGKSQVDPKPAAALDMPMIRGPGVDIGLGKAAFRLPPEALDSHRITANLSPTEKALLLMLKSTQASDDRFYSRVSWSLCEREVGELIAYLESIRKRMQSARGCDHSR